MGRAIRLWTTVIAMAAGIAIASPAASAQEGGSITGDELAELIRQSSVDGPDFESRGMRIIGEVDLGTLRNIDRPLRCIDCTFEGRIDGADVQFGGIIDLSGSVFLADVDLRGAVFGRATIFDGVLFSATVDFGSARFTDIASFAGSEFVGEAVFDRTVFEASASFIGIPRAESARPQCGEVQGSFLARVSFEGSLFGDRADMRGRCFEALAAFSNSAFLGSADFASSTFYGSAMMEGLDLRAGASFRVSEFGGDVSFEGTTTSAALNFEGATFRGMTILESVSGEGSVSLDGVLFAAPPDALPLEMRNLFVQALSMDVPQVNLVSGPNVRKKILTLIEDTSRERGQTSKANQARFELLSSKNEDMRGPRRAFDSYLYRDVAGYLVRPTHPLVAFGILLLVGAFVRAGSLWRQGLADWRKGKARKRPTLKGSVSGAVKALDYFFTGLSGALASAFGKRPYKKPDESSDSSDRSERDRSEDAEPLKPHLLKFGRWTEFLSYKSLIGVFLLGVGNANSTVQELIDTVF